MNSSRRILTLLSTIGVIVFLYASPVIPVLAAPTGTTTCKEGDTNCVNLQVPIGSIKSVDVCTKNGENLECNGIAVFLGGIYQWIIQAAAIVAVVILMAGGMRWMTARGDKSGTTAATKMISNALIGLVLLLGSYSLLYLINPRLTVFSSLSLGKPIVAIPLDVKTIASMDLTDPNVPTTGGEGGGQDGVPLIKQATKSGCALTSLAMVLRHYTGKTDITEATMYQLNGGSATANWGPILSKFNQQNSTSFTFGYLDPSFQKEADQLIKSGKPIILYTTSSAFTRGTTHFVVITGYDATKNLYHINDPGYGKTTATLAELTSGKANNGDPAQFAYGYLHQ